MRVQVFGRNHAGPAAQPRRSLRARRQAQRRLLSGDARLQGGHGHAGRRVPAGLGVQQRPRPRPLRDRRAGGPSGAGRSTVGLYHLAWEVDTLRELERIAGKLGELNALVGASDHSTTKALYAKDPDELEFEVSWLVPADLLTEETLSGRAGIKPLDIAREKERYGADTRGGLGVSIPV